MPPRRRPRRGEVWIADLGRTIGREQAGRRPALVMSADRFNQGAAELVVVVPMTTAVRGIPLHVPLQPPEGGVDRLSFIKCEDVRAISVERLAGPPLGRVGAETIASVADRLRILLDV